ncbi:MAG: pantetheine-phosphate adenylyltransferase [Clostridia bacterium]|nr:pantetheine-phosphate adenylyltransferase [Clostridia bacterium]
MTKAVFPGSFDPVTNGHLDIIKRAAALFDEVIVAVVDNAEKKNMFTLEERLGFVNEAIAGLENVSAESFKGLVIDFVKEKGADVIVRGVRGVSDFDYEYELSDIYYTTGGAESVFLPSRGENAHVSSSMVRELIRYGRDPSEFIPFKLKG